MTVAFSTWLIRSTRLWRSDTFFSRKVLAWASWMETSEERVITVGTP